MHRQLINYNSSAECNKLIDDRVSKPKIVGYYSVDGERNYLPDSSQIQYYNPKGEGMKNKRVCLDLNAGIESAVRKASDEDGRISHLLHWIESNHAEIRAPRTSKSFIEPTFVCSSGLLAAVMCFPYQPDSGWIICAAMWKGTIYMCRFDTAAETEMHRKMPKKYESWGFKFEQYMLSADPCKDPDASKPVIEPAEFRCLFHRRFGNHSVLFSAEIDGVCSKTALKDPLPLDDLRFVELKTTKNLISHGQIRNFRKFKLLRWWAQSFLVNNVAVLCGFRDDAGIVRDLQTYTPDEMVEMSKNFWDPVHCVMECEIFLNHVASTVVDDCTKTIYKFQRKPFGDVVVEKVSPQSEFAFLPSSYLETTRKMSK